MLQLLDLSKSPVLHESSAARWKAIKKLGVDGIKRCGWLVRRVIERCRCKWVEAETEFDVFWTWTLSFNFFNGGSQLPAAPHTPCGMSFSVPMPVAC